MTASTVYWIDGIRTASLPLPDRGLDFGDGLFETFLLAHDRIFYRERHFQRMRSGLLRLGFPDCTDIAKRCLNTVLEEAFELGIRVDLVEWDRVRLGYSRKDDGRGEGEG